MIAFNIYLFLILSIPAFSNDARTDSAATNRIYGASSSIAISSPIYIAAGSSLTLQGANGSIVSGSSISASSFFGDGSNLTGILSLSSTQTFSGSIIFQSSVTVQSGGRAIILSTGPSMANIQISPDGAISFYPGLHNSSSTIVPLATATNTHLGPCVSTITITTTGGAIEAIFSGEIQNDAASPDARLSFLQDAHFPPELVSGTNDKAIGGFVNTTTWPAIFMTTKMRWLFDPPSPGQHSYCLTMAAFNGGTTTLLDRTANIFTIREIK
jgi:hypothetical protein